MSDSCPLPDSIAKPVAQKRCSVASQECQRAECRNHVTRFEVQDAEEDAIAQRRGGNQEAETAGKCAHDAAGKQPDGEQREGPVGSSSKKALNRASTGGGNEW